ncbi:MAG: DUF234 domain-containing protein [Campylobacterota bacterium]|nr:DUF234 domain-containing protein [Campylobacterota bacterium]
MEILIEYFAVFGGLGWEIDTTKPLVVLIEELILENFDILDKKMQEITLFEFKNQKLLHSFAVGDRRIFSAFNRSGLNNVSGGFSLNSLEAIGVVNVEYSREEDARKLNSKGKVKREVARHRISHKVLFNQPFIRFWFYFIFPFRREIKENNYFNFKKNFQKKQNSYTSLVFEELSNILLNYHLRDAQIVSSGSYWNAKLEIDIMTITDKDEIYVGECKWTNHKINKKEFHKIQDKCEKLSIDVKQIAFFSKRGFSKELRTLEGSFLALYDSEDFKVLLKNISKDELIDSFIS